MTSSRVSGFKFHVGVTGFERQSSKRDALEKMKEETNLWLNKAKGNLGKAKDNLPLGHYDLVSFLSHQSAEMALKSFLIEMKGQFPRTHDLVRLGELAGLDSDMMKDCERLTYVYTESRYPDSGLWEHTREETENDIAIAQRILEWITNRIS